ncbi:hypothetical protein M1247_13020 [Mycobacterium sp. 21AC1]|uniref:hypothetical protein n=1 Tax=[Mycobacterium] appelbergii TaxID=2939269 RepID=UPI002938DB92|nr:hypothetical protein [Mycobacterium sp. 21AC1]MDV3125843.1 hypothetical protein [Mycobacterium sp. 21AC1]
MYSTRAQEISHQVQTFRQIDAVAVTDSTTNASRPPAGITVTAQWMNGSVSFKQVVHTNHRLEAGDHFTMWVTPEGKPTAAPRTNSDAVGDAAVAVLGVCALSVALCSLILAAVRAVLDRVRRRAWDVELVMLTANNGGTEYRRS